MKTKIEIIDETYNYYRVNWPKRRAIGSSGACVILSGDNRTCAIGRCLKPEVRKKYLDDAGPFLSTLISNSLFLPKYEGHDIDFWRKMQHWHDKSRSLKEFTQTYVTLLTYYS